MVRNLLVHRPESKNNRPKVLLLGISYPDVFGQMKKHKFDDSVLVHKTPSVEQAVECVRRGILTEMDGRDLARCIATELVYDVDVYTVSKEIGAVYRSDRHVHANFNARNFCQTLRDAFGEDIQFAQVVLDYYWMPTGWLVTRWAKTLFQRTLADLVRLKMLTFPPTRRRGRGRDRSQNNNNNNIGSTRSSARSKKNNRTTNGNTTNNKNTANHRFTLDRNGGFDEGVVYLPFCAHVCKELVGAMKVLQDYYAITFVKKSELSGHSLWKGTMEIDADTMQGRLGKRLDQEEIYCTFAPTDIGQSMEDEHVSKESVMRILRAIEDYDDVRMIRLQPLRQHEPPSVMKERLVEPERGGFYGLNFNLWKELQNKKKHQQQQGLIEERQRQKQELMEEREKQKHEKKELQAQKKKEKQQEKERLLHAEKLNASPKAISPSSSVTKKLSTKKRKLSPSPPIKNGKKKQQPKKKVKTEVSNNDDKTITILEVQRDKTEDQQQPQPQPQPQPQQQQQQQQQQQHVLLENNDQDDEEEKKEAVPYIDRFYPPEVTKFFPCAVVDMNTYLGDNHDDSESDSSPSPSTKQSFTPTMKKRPSRSRRLTRNSLQRELQHDDGATKEDLLELPKTLDGLNLLHKRPKRPKFLSRNPRLPSRCGKNNNNVSNERYETLQWLLKRRQEYADFFLAKQQAAVDPSIHITDGATALFQFRNPTLEKVEAHSAAKASNDNDEEKKGQPSSSSTAYFKIPKKDVEERIGTNEFVPMFFGHPTKAYEPDGLTLQMEPRADGSSIFEAAVRLARVLGRPTDNETAVTKIFLGKTEAEKLEQLKTTIETENNESKSLRNHWVGTSIKPSDRLSHINRIVSWLLHDRAPAYDPSGYFSFLEERFEQELVGGAIDLADKTQIMESKLHKELISFVAANKPQSTSQGNREQGTPIGKFFSHYYHFESNSKEHLYLKKRVSRWLRRKDYPKGPGQWRKQKTIKEHELFQMAHDQLLSKASPIFDMAGEIASRIPALEALGLLQRSAGPKDEKLEVANILLEGFKLGTSVKAGGRANRANKGKAAATKKPPSPKRKKPRTTKKTLLSNTDKLVIATPKTKVLIEEDGNSMQPAEADAKTTPSGSSRLCSKSAKNRFKPLTKEEEANKWYVSPCFLRSVIIENENRKNSTESSAADAHRMSSPKSKARTPKPVPDPLLGTLSSNGEKKQKPKPHAQQPLAFPPQSKTPKAIKARAPKTVPDPLLGYPSNLEKNQEPKSQAQQTALAYSNVIESVVTKKFQAQRLSSPKTKKPRVTKAQKQKSLPLLGSLSDLEKKQEPKPQAQQPALAFPNSTESLVIKAEASPKTKTPRVSKAQKQKSLPLLMGTLSNWEAKQEPNPQAKQPAFAFPNITKPVATEAPTQRISSPKSKTPRDTKARRTLTSGPNSLLGTLSKTNSTETGVISARAKLLSSAKSQKLNVTKQKSPPNPALGSSSYWDKRQEQQKQEPSRYREPPKTVLYQELDRIRTETYAVFYACGFDERFVRLLESRMLKKAGNVDKETFENEFVRCYAEIGNHRTKIFLLLCLWLVDEDPRLDRTGLFRGFLEHCRVQDYFQTCRNIEHAIATNYRDPTESGVEEDIHGSQLRLLAQVNHLAAYGDAGVIPASGRGGGRHYQQHQHQQALSTRNPNCVSPSPPASIYDGRGNEMMPNSAAAAAAAMTGWRNYQREIMARPQFVATAPSPHGSSPVLNPPPSSAARSHQESTPHRAQAYRPQPPYASAVARSPQGSTPCRLYLVPPHLVAGAQNRPQPIQAAAPLTPAASLTEANASSAVSRIVAAAAAARINAAGGGFS